MAKKDIKKENLHQLKNIVSIAQIVCFIYGFFCVFYWFLNLTKLSVIKFVAFLFEPTFAFVRTFYKQTNTGAGYIDLSGVIACMIFILLAVIAKIAKDKIEELEDLHAIEMKKKQKAEDILAQKQIELEYYREMRKYNKFVVLVDFGVHQIKSYIFDNNIDQDELRGIKINLTAELFNSIKDDYIIQKSKYENDSFYIIGKIEQTPECVNTITSTIRELSKKYSDKNIALSYDISFDAISDKTNINEKLEFLKKVLQLSYTDVMITTSLFKTCYELISKSQLKFTELGSFQFIVSGKSSNYELYSVKKIN